jgi:hypothetical protein
MFLSPIVQFIHLFLVESLISRHYSVFNEKPEKLLMLQTVKYIINVSIKEF